MPTTRPILPIIFLAFATLTFGQAAPKASAAKPAEVAASAPDTPKPLKPGEKEEVLTKSFDLKFADPEKVRGFFTARSFVMDANRDLKVLTAHGTASFLKEVDDAVKRFDVPPPPPANIQITVYLLTAAAQAPAGGPLTPELAATGKELAAAGFQSPRVADSQVIRVREGQPGEVNGPVSAPDAAGMARVRIQSVSVTPGPKGDLVSLNGLKVWLNMPPAPASPKTDADISADMDLEQNQPAIVSKTGVDKPVVVVVRASVVH